MSANPYQSATRADLAKLQSSFDTLSKKLDTTQMDIEAKISTAGLQPRATAEDNFASIDNTALDFTQPNISNAGGTFTGETDAATANKLTDAKGLVLGAFVIWLVFYLLKRI